MGHAESNRGLTTAVFKKLQIPAFDKIQVLLFVYLFASNSWTVFILTVYECRSQGHLFKKCCVWEQFMVVRELFRKNCLWQIGSPISKHFQIFAYFPTPSYTEQLNAIPATPLKSALYEGQCHYWRCKNCLLCDSLRFWRKSTVKCFIGSHGR